MNGKKAKRLRQRAKEIACTIIRERILSPEWTKDKDCDSLLVALPERAYYWKGFTRHLGMGSRKWINRQVKKQPDVTVDNLIGRMYGTN